MKDCGDAGVESIEKACPALEQMVKTLDISMR